MSSKRKIFNIFAAVVMVFGSLPITFASTYADEPAGIVPEEENIPKSLKKVHSNNDGTYDITLEIEGVSSQKTDATKANVVVVFDSSGSMGGTARTYDYNVSSNGQYGLIDGDYLRLYRWNNGGWGGGYCSEVGNNYNGTVYSDDDCDVRYSGTRYSRNAVDHGTRIQVAKDAVNALANQLLAQNDPSDSNLKDVVEMAFVDFATTVKTDTTHVSSTTDLDTFKGWVNATSANGGTNWEDALTEANNISFGEDDTDKTYIIFVSDGNPTFRNSRYNDSATDCLNTHWEGWTRVCNDDTIWGEGDSDNNGWNLEAAKIVAATIAQNDNKELYTVGTFGEASNMRSLGGTYYDAADQDALEEAFAEIVDKIKMGLSVADLQIEDGITPATSTEVDGTAGNFRYDVPESWGDDWTGATFEGGSVHWNPGEHRTLKNGEKASVTFTVWPSQEAMDCIAAIRNNGREACSESDLAKFGLGEKEDGSFKLITNSVATFRFRTATKNEDTGETEYSEISVPIDFTEERDPTDLPETTLQVMKKWLDSMGSQRGDISRVSIDLYVDRDLNSDPERHYTFDYQDGSEWIGKDENGKSEYTVAPGVMKELDGTEKTAGLEDIAIKVVKVGSKRYAVLEAGHDYEFDGEVVDYSGSTNHYHITKREYHPMIVNDGEIHNVIFNGDGTDDSEETAVIEEENLENLAVENTLNGGVLVSKVVINNDEVDREIEDKYEITIFNIKDKDGNLLSHTETNPMQYRILNCSVTNGKENCVNADENKKPFYDGTITEKINTNQKIRIGDLPTGATFEVKETQPEGYEPYSVKYQLEQYDDDENATILDDREHIQKVFGNSSAQAIVTNRLESGDLTISKTVTATSGNLTEAQKKVFSFIVKFYKQQGDEVPVRTDAETCKAVKHGETCTINDIPKGWYYEIVEAAKPGFNNGLETTKTGTIARGDNEVKFTNDYSVSPVSATIIAHKRFVQGYEQFWINSDIFEFQLIGNNQIIDNKNVTLSGDTAEFNVDIVDAGTYTYTVTEKTKDDEGNSVFRQGILRQADDEDIVVTIVVVDDGEGALKIDSQTYSKVSQTIYNLYEDSKVYGANGELKFTKDLQGRDWKSSDKFNFVITGSENAPMPSKTIAAADKEHKTVDFGTIKFNEKNVGKTYVYTVREEFDVPSVEPAENVAGGITFTVEVLFDEESGNINLVVSGYEKTFVNIYKTTEVTAAKVWNDDGDRDGLRENYDGYFVAVKNDEGKYVAYQALALEDKDDYIFTDLQEKNVDGEMIHYTIVEASTCSGNGDSIRCTEFASDDDYEAIINNNTIINTHKPELINNDDDDDENDGKIVVTKIWEDENDALKMRPGSIIVHLYADGEEIDSATIVPDDDGNWTHTFAGLYKDSNGSEIVYSVEESYVDGYEAIVNDEDTAEGFMITNKSTRKCTFDGCGSANTPIAPNTGRLTREKKQGAAEVTGLTNIWSGVIVAVLSSVILLSVVGVKAVSRKQKK